MAQMFHRHRYGVEQGRHPAQRRHQLAFHGAAITRVIHQKSSPPLYGYQENFVLWREVFAKACQHVPRTAPLHRHASAAVQNDGQRDQGASSCAKKRMDCSRPLSSPKMVLRQTGDRPVLAPESSTETLTTRIDCLRGKFPPLQRRTTPATPTPRSVSARAWKGYHLEIRPCERSEYWNCALSGLREASHFIDVVAEKSRRTRSLGGAVASAMEEGKRG